MDKKLTEELIKINLRLSKIKLRIKNNRVYLRGTLPPKPNEGVLPRQYELSTGLAANPQGLKIALARAQEIESRLVLNQFSWGDYLQNGILGTKPASQWIAEFEEHYWLTHQKNIKREYVYGISYGNAFSRLAPDEPLSEKAIIPIISAYQVDAPRRDMLLNYYIQLFKFAGIANTLHQLKVSWKVKVKRELPSDLELIDFVDSVKEDYRWIFGTLAAYGLRSHELIELDLSRAHIEPYVVKVSDNTKTGARLVYPVPGDWVNRWKLYEKHDPIYKTRFINYDYGTRIYKLFLRETKRLKIRTMSPYHFRDAYAVRCSLLGVDAAIASKWMGHSLKIHWESYLRFFDESHHNQAWMEMNKNIKSKSKKGL